MHQIEALISDADGTLVDTARLIRHGQHEAAVSYLKAHGIPGGELPTYEQYELVLNQHVGGSTRQTFERTVAALYADRVHHIDGIDYDALNRLLDPVQDRIAPEYVKAFPYLSATLAQLGGVGMKLAICTSGTPYHIVRNFGIALGSEVGDCADLYRQPGIAPEAKLDIFTSRLEAVYGIPQVTVVTCDDVGARTKPDPLSVQMAMERLGAAAEQCAILGDHAYDMRAGVAAGIGHRLGITHGFDDAALLRAAGATQVITSLRELAPVLADK